MTTMPQRVYGKGRIDGITIGIFITLITLAIGYLIQNQTTNY